MREHFETQLDKLNNELILMGSFVEEAIARTVRALVEQNSEMAQQVIAFDEVIDAKEKDIEALCMRALLEHQLSARDLRTISAALKMITDMEASAIKRTFRTDFALYGARTLEIGTYLHDGGTDGLDGH